MYWWYEIYQDKYTYSNNKSNKYAIIATKIVPFYFSCNVCDTLFNTSMSLEYHKEEFGHWTSDEDDDYDEDEEIGKI